MGKILRKGSSGDAVRVVQRELKRHGAPDLEATGKYDAQTEEAVRHFQESVGFTGRDVDGVVGSKTMLALFQTFDIKIRGHLIPSLRAPIMPSSAPSASPAPEPVDTKSGETKTDKPGGMRLLANWQFGYQRSKRDGPGYQFQLSLSALTQNYFPSSSENKFYHSAHAEIIPQLAFGIPIPPGSSIYTGQLGITIQPLTDWLVIYQRWHLFTPAIGVFGQIPLNVADGPKSDPATHSRGGFTLGGQAFQVDLDKEGWSLGLSGQVAGYHDFTDNKFHWDPSILAQVQGPLGKW